MSQDIVRTPNEWCVNVKFPIEMRLLLALTVNTRDVQVDVDDGRKLQLSEAGTEVLNSIWSLLTETDGSDSTKETSALSRWTESVVV